MLRISEGGIRFCPIVRLIFTAIRNLCKRRISAYFGSSCLQSFTVRYSNPFLSTVRQLAITQCVMAVCFLANSTLLPTVKAQSSTATLSGKVTDENGAVIPAVTVSVINVSQGFQRVTTTNAEGIFVIALLPPNKYVVNAQREGFAMAEIRNVVLNVNDQVTLDIQLKVGAVGGNVIVSDVSLLKESAEVSTVIDRQFVKDLALNGRSFQSLITLTPGVVLTKAKINEQGQFSVNGQRANANYFWVDGVSANIGVTPGVSGGQSTAGTLPGLSAGGGTNNLVSVDALEEFRVLTSSYAPEFGRTPGAQVSIVTRSGTKDFHGTIFNYLRNDVLDANDWFANSRNLPKPAERQNDFGATFNGPILLPRFGEGGNQPLFNGRNGTFFFFSYEGLRLRQPQTGITAVPSVNARQSALPSMQPFLNAYSRPNGKDLGNNFSEFNATYSDPSTLDATSIRVDHTVNSKLTLFGRYNYAPSSTIGRGVARSLSTLTLARFRTKTLTAGGSMMLTPAISNDVRWNYSNNSGDNSNLIDNFGGAVPLPDSILFPQPRSSQDSSFFLSLGSNPTTLSQGKFAFNAQRQINLVDSLFVTSGAHQFKFGLDYRRLFPIFDFRQYDQTIQFAGVNGALTNQASSATIGAILSPLFPRIQNFSLFAQDTWKTTSRLTLTYGIRWEVNPPPHEENGNDPLAVIGLDDPATLALAPRGTPIYQTTYGNFAPRVGIAYQISQRPGRETLLRGGFGVFYDVGNGQAAGGIGSTYPNRTSKTLTNVPFPLDPVSSAAPPFSLNAPYGSLFGIMDPNLELPYTYQWNVAVEQSLNSNQTISISYLGAVGRGLLRQELLVRPNPNFTNIRITRNSATSDYHALQIQFQRRLARGIQALASYTWSHSIDTVSDESSSNIPVQKIDPQRDRGPSDFDIRHVFNGAVTYDLPILGSNAVTKAILGNWSLDTILTIRSATPINVTTGTDVLGVGLITVARPNLITGVPLYLDDSSVGGGKRINRAAFSSTPDNQQGSLGRNALRGFPVWQLDLSLRRQFNFTENFKAQFMADFFNIFNHPNFGDPDGNLRSATFGQSVSMLGRSLGSGGIAGGFNPLYQVGGPRSVQLAVKLIF